MRLAAHVCAATMIATAIAVPVRAQDAGQAARPEKPPRAKPPPPDDPRRGPRLEYTRGPAECLSERDFRDEVAVILDSVDHLDPTSPGKLTVKFERLSLANYRGTLVPIDAAGQAGPATVKTYNNCELLGRWIAGTASGFIPEAPKPPPPPAPLPELPACEVRPACGDTRLPLLAAWASLPSAPAGINTFEVVAPPPTFREWLRKMDLSIAFSGVMLLGVGVTESVSPGFGLAADIRGKMFSFALEVRGVPPGKVYARVPIDPKKPYATTAFDLSEWTGLLVPCVRYSYFVGCGLVQAGVAPWDSRLDSGAYPIFNLGARAGFEVGFKERFAVFGFGELLIRTIIPYNDFSLAPEGSLPANVTWEAPPVAGYLAVGLLVKID